MDRLVVLPPAPLEPAPLDLRWPLGVPLDLRVTFQTFKGAKVDVTLYHSKFVLFPRSAGGQKNYDMPVYDGVNGILHVNLPADDLTDPKGYNFEIYSRPSDTAEPTAMPVLGTIVTYGKAYAKGSLTP